MGTEYLFLEDDSLLAKKRRAIDIFQALKGSGMKLIDVNGVNIVHLTKNAGNGKMVIDREFLEAMADSGFEKLSLPFESGSQRILDKYASHKWRTDRLDTVDLIHTMRDLRITALGNYTIGYPTDRRGSFRITNTETNTHSKWSTTPSLLITARTVVLKFCTCLLLSVLSAGAARSIMGKRTIGSVF